jgi:hypothetical protein
MLVIEHIQIKKHNVSVIQDLCLDYDGQPFSYERLVTTDGPIKRLVDLFLSGD